MYFEGKQRLFRIIVIGKIKEVIMLLDVISKLLDRSFSGEPDYRRLDRLESDVWARIAQSKAANDTISFVMPVWSNVNLRYASLILAMIGGLFVAQMSSYETSTPEYSKALGLDVFSPDDPFFISANIKYIDIRKS